MTEKITFASNGRVWLTLSPDKSYKQHRQIGRVNFEKRCFLTKRAEKHIMRVNNSIGLSSTAVRKMKESGLIDFIVIELQKGLKIHKLKTTPEFWLAHGEYLHFVNNKLELQIFLNLDLFGVRQAKKWAADQAKITSEIKTTQRKPDGISEEDPKNTKWSEDIRETYDNLISEMSVGREELI